MNGSQKTHRSSHVGLTGLLTFCLLGLGLSAPPTHAESFVYIGADPSSAEGDFMMSADATINGKPFWQVMEPYVGKAGVCANPMNSEADPSDTSEAVLSAPVIDQRPIDSIIAGLERGEDWLSSKSLWPLKSHQLVSVDPKAPNAIPVFCSLTAAPMENHLIDLLDTAGDTGSSSYFLIVGTIPPDSQRRDQDLATAATRAVIATLHEDNVVEIFNRADNRFFGSSKNVDEQKENLTVYKQMLKSIVNAMTYSALEADFGFGPAITKQFIGATSELHAIDFYSLTGVYHKPFYQIEKSVGRGLTSAGFWHFLFEGYLSVGFERVPELIYTLASTDNQLNALNEFIDAHDGDYHTGLVHALPNFGGASSTWPEIRNLTRGRNARYSRFGRCEEVTLSEDKTVHEFDMELEPYSIRCVNVNFEPGASRTLFDAHIKVVTGDDKVNGIELGSGRYRKSELSRSKDDKTCYRLLGFQTKAEGLAKVERTGLSSNLTCTLAFSQGNAPETEELTRFFYLGGEGSTTDLTARQLEFVVTYTPDEHKPFTEEAASTASARFVFSVDSAQLQSVLFDDQEVESVFASKSGNMPVTPLATEKTNTFDDSVLEGRATAVDPSLLQSAAAFSDNRVGVMDDNNTSIEFQFVDPSIIDSKAIGEFDVIPVFQKDGFIAIPDSEKPSKINIIKHDKDTLYFEADAYICMMEPEEILSSMEQRYLDICSEGERHKITSKVHIPFPDQFRSKSRIVWHETDNYKASRAIRLHQIKQKFAASSLPIGNSNQTQNPANAGSTESPSRAAGSSACMVKQASGACNCSCEVSRCLNSQPAIADSAEALSCRLTCGKRWRDCGQ